MSSVRPNQKVRVKEAMIKECYLGEEWLGVIGVVKKVSYYSDKPDLVFVQHPQGFTHVFIEDEIEIITE